METKKNKLVISEKEGVICYGYFQDGIPAELYCEAKEQESLLGNIYAARVERIAEGIQGAFLEIGEGQKCYYSLSGEQPIKLSPGHENKLYAFLICIPLIHRVNQGLPGKNQRLYPFQGFCEPTFFKPIVIQGTVPYIFCHIGKKVL